MARILLIDDDTQLREMLTEVLRDSGHDVNPISDGKYAKGAFIKGHYDIVITDIVMPEKDGLKTIQELRELFPNMKIIAISGGDRSFSGDTYLNLAKNFGAHRILTKPFSHKTILAAIEELMKE
jgi:DNA-binding response OmpR family regulator